MFLIYIPLISSGIGILYSIFLIFNILKYPKGETKIVKIADAIEQGAKAYLKTQYKTVAIIGILIALILTLTLGWEMSLSFLIGVLFSELAGFLGMLIAVKSNIRTTKAAESGLKSALKISVKGGAVTGILVASLGILSLSILYLIFQTPKILIALGFGGSLISVFAGLGGGIYTKAADVGADLVGKIETGIPEDDPRNPAVIADNVGDNVGDCAGMAADLFETYIVTLGASMFFINLIKPNSNFVLLPLLIGSVGLLTSIIGISFIKLSKNKSIIQALYKGLVSTSILSIILYAIIFKYINFNEKFIFWFFPILTGIVLAFLMMFITDYYTSKKYSPVQAIAKASQSGHATNIIIGLAKGMQSTFFPIIAIVLAILICYKIGGFLGVALASCSMLSLTGIIITISAYGPIVDNAGGIAEMGGLSEKIREVTDSLDAVGNTTKAVTKAYAIESAGLATLILFSSYTYGFIKTGVNIKFLLNDPFIIAGLLLGASIPYLFASFALSSVGKVAGKVIKDVREQFAKNPEIMQGTKEPNYSRTVSIVTKGALKEMIIPTIIIVLAPILCGFILGPKALGGFLIGTIISGLLVAISMTSSGAAWDNAKKYIEAGNLGGKGSEAHKASITGDTVGDPYKDTAGPAINPVIKVINIIALLISSFLL